VSELNVTPFTFVTVFGGVLESVKRLAEFCERSNNLVLGIAVRFEVGGVKLEV
jgi:hypothetical protein